MANNPARQGSGNGRDQLQRPLLVSAAGHVILLIAATAGALIGHRTVMWGESGNGGGAASVRLVSAASVPLPPPSLPSTNKVANEEPGLHHPEAPQPEAKHAPKPAPKPEPEDAIELPGRGRRLADKKPPRTQLQARLARPGLETPPGNEIPYGAGGPPQGPYGMFQTTTGAGGFAFDQAAGDFGGRFGWYVTALRNRISSNWLQGTIDPGIQSAPRVFVTFQILRDGRIVNTQLTASSGIASLDRSALRAVSDSNPMPPLPADYSGSGVAVEFWFDFRR